MKCTSASVNRHFSSLNLKGTDSMIICHLAKKPPSLSDSQQLKARGQGDTASKTKPVSPHYFPLKLEWYKRLIVW